MEQERQQAAAAMRRVVGMSLTLVAAGLPAGVLLPALGLADARLGAGALVLALMLAVSAVFAAAAAVLAQPASRFGAVLSLMVVAVGSWLLTWVSYAGSGIVVAAIVGLGVGLLVDRVRMDRRRLTATGAAAVALAVVVWLGGTAWAGGLLVAVALVRAGEVVAQPPAAPSGWRRKAPWGAILGLGAAAFGVFWVGSTSPRVEWFGALTSHGPRDVNEVAITFDDGPNPEATLAIAAILKQYGVKGTFFEVGKAVVARPDVTKQLADAGNVIGNHSYHHDAFRYLDPRYPELAAANTSIRNVLGVCPGLFRPPHGTHTPFMSHEVTSRGMQLVTWDVSAKDWAETDPQKVAQHILEKVRPGSIILLHDGIDGNIPADRSVVVGALPAILDGLRAKGLQPVTLDKLLDVPAYLPVGRC